MAGPCESTPSFRSGAVAALRALLLAGACAAALALDQAPVLAQTELISNIAVVNNRIDFNSSSDRAQSFTTGGNAAGYTLSSVGIVSTDGEGDSFDVSVCTVDSGGFPTSTCTALEAPTGTNAFAAGTITFTHETGVPLAANTDYTVLVEPSALVRLSYQREGLDDSGGAAERSIDDWYDYFDSASSSWGPAFDSRSLRTRIQGTLNNSPAAGAPAISGGPQVGKTLTAGVGTIADADGLPDAFPDDYDFQWIRVDGTDETDIAGAASGTYTLAAGDVGKQVKVKVTFADDAGNVEARTSAAYPAEGTVEGLVIAIAPDRPKALGAFDHVHWRLSREGPTTDELTVTVTLAPPAGNDWNIPDDKLDHEVTFEAGEAMAALVLKLARTGPGNIGFSGGATVDGTLRATLGDVVGYDTSDDAEVEAVTVPNPKWIGRLLQPAYTFPNRLLGAATLSRLRHGAYRLTLEGETYRSPRFIPERRTSTVATAGETKKNHTVRDQESAPVSGGIQFGIDTSQQNGRTDP